MLADASGEEKEANGPLLYYEGLIDLRVLVAPKSCSDRVGRCSLLYKWGLIAAEVVGRRSPLIRGVN